ncbi:hypothetical protein [Bdellovibrio bacteriovorus]|uniref:hypothetical protein n=1 Tax=Bdellovibrio bacteriovorus TaxID=959 RepID=UPI0035A8DB0F
MRIFLFIFFVCFNANTALGNIPAFTKIDSSFSKVSSGNCGSEKGACEIKNMPRVASQDGLGICYAYVAATMMQTENCRVLKQVCATLSEDQLFSPIDLTRLSRPKDGSKPSNIKASYNGLRLESNSSGNDLSGDPHDTVMIAALLTQETGSEACVSLDKILSKMNEKGATQKTQAAMWERLKNHYNSYRSKLGCDSCLSQIYATAVDDINENLNLKSSNQDLLKAFAQDTYEKFLDELLGASKCSETGQLAFFEGASKVTYEMFPEPGDKDPKKLKESVTPTQFKNKVKEVLKTGRPLSLGNICVGPEPAANCRPQNHHAIVIAGYREICNEGGKCRDAFKVINSWGKSWQDENDGGWVDADSLIEHTKMQPYILGWFADKK